MDSFIGWIGGKRLLRKEILARFPADVERYIEVFGGAAWVLFGKEKIPGQLEVYNDRNRELVNLFRCIKYHCGELQRELDWMLTSRELFQGCMEQLQTPENLTDIQRAARFFYIVKISFGCDRRTYATSSKTIDNAAAYLKKVQERLRGVNIENKDFADLIRVYDRPSALFYLDPPYVGTERYYDQRSEVSFTAKDHQRLREVLGGIKGRFILSYNDCPLVRELYRDYTIEAVTRKNTLVGTSNRTSYAEVIVKNF